MTKIKKRNIRLVCLLIVAIVGLGFVLFHSVNFAVLHPEGTVARQERDLIVFATLLSLIVVLPVFGFLFGFAWRYREGNHYKKEVGYLPDWDGNRVAETVWWLIPLALIIVLGTITWTSTHKLDPTKPIASTVKPITIQAVALQWRWLFIHPDENIAEVNQLHIPVGTPVNIEITADAPMNSLWIPQLGGQIYAMSGMETQLHLAADHAGRYRGSSANISGKGFASMHFMTTAVDRDTYREWSQKTAGNTQSLSMDRYTKLAQPSEDTATLSYGDVMPNLFEAIMNKYMEPAS